MVAGVVVLVLVGAGPEGEEQHVDHHLVHGHVVTVVLSHQSNVRGFDVEPPSLAHGQVELRKPEEQSIVPIVSLTVGYGFKAGSSVFQSHAFELDYALLVVFVDRGVDDYVGDADKFDVIVGFGCYVVEHGIASVEKGLYFDEIVRADVVGQLQSSDGC